MDECKPQYFKKGGLSVIELLVRIFDVCQETGRVPEECDSACIVLFYKGKGSGYECRNSSSISLLSVVSKVYWRVLMEGIRSKVGDVISHVQRGF